jgi:DUF4097 and DUF4098 domain-containing protein YvlB
VIGFRGELDAQTSDGMMNLEGEFTKLDARSSDGAVNIIVPDDTSADLEATCENITGDGIELKRVSGDENLTLYRMGRGGNLFSIKTEGEITVRSAQTLRAGN